MKCHVRQSAPEKNTILMQTNAYLWVYWFTWHMIQNHLDANDTSVEYRETSIPHLVMQHAASRSVWFALWNTRNYKTFNYAYFLSLQRTATSLQLAVSNTSLSPKSNQNTTSHQVHPDRIRQRFYVWATMALDGTRSVGHRCCHLGRLFLHNQRPHVVARLLVVLVVTSVTVRKLRGHDRPVRIAAIVATVTSPVRSWSHSISKNHKNALKMWSEIRNFTTVKKLTLILNRQYIRRSHSW